MLLIHTLLNLLRRSVKFQKSIYLMFKHFVQKLISLILSLNQPTLHTMPTLCILLVKYMYTYTVARAFLKRTPLLGISLI